jgi:hypothetical protein
MAHFAKIESGIVTTVNVINNYDITDEDGFERPELAMPLLSEGVWIQCSYTGRIRGAYPGIGWGYDPLTDTFVPPPAEQEQLAEQSPDAESLTEPPAEG